MIRFFIGMATLAILGFIVFLFIGVFIMGSIWPDLSYEVALPYLLFSGFLGALLLVLMGKQILRLKTKK